MARFVRDVGSRSDQSRMIEERRLGTNAMSAWYRRNPCIGLRAGLIALYTSVGYYGIG